MVHVSDMYVYIRDGLCVCVCVCVCVYAEGVGGE